MSVPIEKLTAFLDEFLNVSSVPDSPHAFNGLQVQKQGPVRSILAAVDASQASIEAAVAGEHDLLLVHHGLFWDGPNTVTGRSYERLRPLLTNNVAVYSAHIPLDLHPEVGNNAILAALLELENVGPFGAYEGVAIGVLGETNLTLDDLVAKLGSVLDGRATSPVRSKSAAGRVAVVTGAGGSFIKEAVAELADTFITGEVSHHNFFDAEEAGLNLVLGGHYATETVGVRALAEKLATEFSVEWSFFDHPTGL